MKNDLSFIIVNRDTRELLLGCLKSIYTTVGDKLKFEIFVVDNGSTDGSAEAVSNNFPAVNLIKNKQNLGFAKANNQALKRISTPYALLLNSDTSLTAGAVEELFNFMESRPLTGITGGQLLNRDGTRQNSFANFPSLATELLNKSLLQILFSGKYPGKRREYRSPLPVDSVLGACMIVRARAMEDTGMFDENYFFFLEETDWCLRMQKNNWKVFFLPSAKIYHFQGESQKKQKAESRIECYRSRYLFFSKNRSRLSLFILKTVLPLRLALNFLLTGICCLFSLFLAKKPKERFYVYGRLLAWHIKGLPAGGLKGTSAAGGNCLYEKNGLRGRINEKYARDKGLFDLLESPDKIFKNETATLVKDGRTTTIARLPLNIGGEIKEINLKRYNNPGLIDPFKNLFRYSRAAKSWEGTRNITSKGFSVPEAIAFLDLRKFRFLKKSFFVCEGISGAEDVARFFKKKEFVSPCLKERRREKIAFISSFAGLIRKLHKAGIYHADLKGKNILVKQGPGEKLNFYFIDLDRVLAGKRVWKRRRFKNLSQINWSFEGIAGRCDRLRFLKAYLEEEFAAQKRVYAAEVERWTGEWRRESLRPRKRRSNGRLHSPGK